MDEMLADDSTRDGRPRPEARYESQVDGAAIVGVGVLRGAVPAGATLENASKPFGVVHVRVRHSGHPVALLLSSQEPVRWMISSDPGARITAVLVTAGKRAIVEGVSSGLIHEVGRDYADAVSGPSVDRLQRAVMQLTGAAMQGFQWAPEGRVFFVSAPPVLAYRPGRSVSPGAASPVR